MAKFKATFNFGANARPKKPAKGKKGKGGKSNAWQAYTSGRRR
jgi:hypothetical protein